MYASVSEVYDLVYAQRQADARFYAEFVAAHVAERSDAVVMEVGAGTGRVLLPIARRMPSVTFHAVDTDGEQLAVLNTRVERLGLGNIIVVNKGIHEIGASGSYDVVTAPFRVLQHCLTLDELAESLRLIAVSLKPAGVFSFDLFNPSIPVLATVGLLTSDTVNDNLGATIHRQVRVHDRSYVEQTQLVEETYVVRHPDGTEQNLRWTYKTRYFFAGEVLPLLREAGLTLDNFYCDFTRTPFGAGEYPGDLVFVAHKPGN